MNSATYGRQLLFVIVGSAAAQRGFVNDAHTTKFAAWSILASTNGSVRSAIGTAKKHPSNPLLVQDQPWEPRLDNAYPNVVHNPHDPLGAYRMWYGGFIAGKDYDKGQGSDRVNAWHYANSSDGVHWQKPALGMFDLGAIPQCSATARAAGRANNIILGGDGTGIFYDADDTNASRRFKAFGTMCPAGGGLVHHGSGAAADAIPVSTDGHSCVSGVAVSADGLGFSDFTAVRWPAPQRYDCHQNMVRDPADGTLVYTTRDGFSGSPGRTVGIALGPLGGAWGVNTSGAPVEVEDGTEEHQLYAQVTFPFYNVWLGLVAVFDTSEPETVGTVHTRLSWAPTPLGPWEWLDKGSPPSSGLTGPAFIPLGKLPEAQKALSGPVTSPPFDSHIIFPAHTPFYDAADGAVRVYYAGGNGPHNGPRNTSIGMARLRPDGFGGLLGSGSVTTVPILVSGPTLIISADVFGQRASVRVGVVGVPGLSIAESMPIAANVTDGAAIFTGSASLGSLVGQHVRLVLELSSAMVYTVGFTRAQPLQVYFGNGCFWARQHTFITLLEQARLKRDPASLKAVAAYAGGALPSSKRLCYHNANSTDVYSDYGAAEVVALELAEAELAEALDVYFDTFVQIAPGVWTRPDAADQGAEYRALIGVPGGLHGALGPTIRAANTKNMTLEEGHGKEADTFGRNVVVVMDSLTFPAVQAELCMQCHDDQVVKYPPAYHALAAQLLRSGRLHPTGCPANLVCG